METERRCRALNLDRDRQLASCLVRWYRELQTGAVRRRREGLRRASCAIVVSIRVERDEETGGAVARARRAVALATAALAAGWPAAARAELPVVYVSRILEGQVAVIDVASDRFISLLGTGSNPAEVGVVEALSRAFVADLTDGTVSVIDTGNHGLEHVIDVGKPVATVGVDEAAQRVFVVDFSNGTPGTDLHVVDAASMTVVGSFTVGTRTQNIAYGDDDDLAYITDFDSGVLVVDTVTGPGGTAIPVADLPHGIALDAAADRLYVTRLEADSVAVIDTTSLTVVDSFAVGDAPQWVALDSARAKAFVTNEGDGTVSVIDTASGTVHAAAIPVGPNPLTITVHEGAAKAYVYNAGDGTISVIDTVGETVIAILEPLFVDGFESGSVGAWTATAP
jgi:YVTN family beta-propeller protein